MHFAPTAFYSNFIFKFAYVISIILAEIIDIKPHIIKSISKAVFHYLSITRLLRRCSYLRYNQNKHCGFVSIFLQHYRFEVTQTTVTCLNL